MYKLYMLFNTYIIRKNANWLSLITIEPDVLYLKKSVYKYNKKYNKVDLSSHEVNNLGHVIYRQSTLMGTTLNQRIYTYTYQILQ